MNIDDVTIYDFGSNSLLAGDFENNDGTGGSSAFADKYLLAEQCPLKVILNFLSQYFKYSWPTSALSR